jgi:CrcB protein
MKQWLCILLGGAFGTGCRYGISLLLNAWVGRAVFPYATFAINVSGSFLIGWLAELYQLQWFDSLTWRLALITGVLGGYTTFSAFSLENLHLLRTGQTLTALSYALGSVTFGLLAAWLGMRCAQDFFR